jgi:hypothetical protein
MSELAELVELEEVIEAGGACLQTRVACQVEAAGRRFPVYVITLGNPAADVAAVGCFGGVHGLERIGSAVVVAYLRSLVSRLAWDGLLHQMLEHVRLVFMPVVNPGGMWLGTRANPNGVDLMRNAPLDAVERVPFLLGGHRISAGLPWYRGRAGAPMEAESVALCRVVEEELLAHPFSVALDCHSGFGARDRIWFPYAHTAAPIRHLAEVFALKGIFEATYRNHSYVFEPQSRQYLAHGDLWDHLYQRACEAPERTLLPLTLEMGSWLWVKKNPRQLLSRHGIFNPLIEHRIRRVLRRHVFLLDFLARSASSYRRWLPAGEARKLQGEQALAHWYAGAAK